jgi:hypothetical protein
MTKEEVQYLLDHKELNDQLSPVLYAITDKKELAKEFKDQRDMDQFFLHKNSDLDKDEIIDFMNNQHGRVLKAFEYKRLIKDTKKDNRWDYDTIRIVSTYQERQSVYDKSDASLLGIPEEINISFPFKFANKYSEALSNLEVDTIWKLRSFSIEQSEEFVEAMQSGLVDEEDYYDQPVIPDALIDEVEIFVYMYGHTFKSK